MTRTNTLALLLFIGGAAHAAAQAPAAGFLLPEYQFESNRAILDEDGDPATNVSGISCMPPSGDKRVCMVVNDEDRSASLIEIAGKTITRKAFVPLIGKQHSSETLGERPSGTACSGGTKKFKDLDGEAVAYEQGKDEAYFYVVGSHGCSRKDSEHRDSFFIVARVKVDAQGNVIGEAATTYRLAPVLQGVSKVGPFFGKGLNSSNGLNVEGAVVMADHLLVGLRAPVHGKTAYLVSLKRDHLFEKVNAPPAGARPIPVALDVDGAGIRDIARLDDGRVLLLIGPAQEQNVPYKIGLLDVRQVLSGGASEGKEFDPLPVKMLGSLQSVPNGKAEGLEVLPADSKESAAKDIRVVVVYDGLPEGGARVYKITLE